MDVKTLRSSIEASLGSVSERTYRQYPRLTFNAQDAEEIRRRAENTPGFMDALRARVAQQITGAPVTPHGDRLIVNGVVEEP